MRGTEILTELHGAFRILLWLLYRDLELAVTVAPERRAGLFRLNGLRAFEKVQLPEPIAGHIRTLCDVLANIRPARAAACCAEIAAWARPHAPRTSLLFAETAARSQPGSPPLARAVGMQAQACGLAPQAEGWLRRAIALARRDRDWSTYAHAYGDLAELAESAGNHAAARKRFRRAMLVYRRSGLERDVRARAALGLFRAALWETAWSDVDSMARAAVRSFDPRDRRAAGVRVQIARALVDAGEFERAAALLASWRSGRSTAAESVALAGLTVRAAAGLGDIATVETGWDAFVVAAGAARSTHTDEIAATAEAVLAALGPERGMDQLATVRAEAARLARAVQR